MAITDPRSNFAENAQFLPKPPTFIDLVLLFEGRLTNERLRQRFQVSNVQASRLLAAYADAYPDNLQRDAGAGRGRYVIGPHFRPHASDGTIDAYLRATVDEPAVTVIDSRVDLTVVRPDVFRALRQAIGDGKGLDIRYRSMTHPDGRVRTIWPHALVFAGHRWHVRAYDGVRAQFVDFNVGRIEAPVPSAEPAPASSMDDRAWATQVLVRLVAHPSLSAAQRRLIRDELFQGAAARVVTCRAAHVRYVVRELEAAMDPDTEQPPSYQIAVSNTDAVARWLRVGTTEPEDPVA